VGAREGAPPARRLAELKPANGIQPTRVCRNMSGQSAVTSMAVETSAGSAAERLGALFDAHQDRLYRLARRLVPSTDDARDLVQETFLRAARAPEAVPVDIAGEEAWLVRVLINIRRDQWRKLAVRRSPAASARLNAGDRPPDPEAALIARRTVWQALDKLHPRRRAVVIMHELDGLPPSRVASLLGISTVTVRWHLSRGRRDLARVLKTCSGETR
jgi:RNA polymerase sigma-70 factor, ECF subfamily